MPGSRPVPVLLPALLGATLALAGPWARADGDPRALVPGVPVTVGLARGAARWTAAVDVPQGTRRLHLLTASRQNVDVAASRERIEGDLSAAATRRETPSGEEHLTVDGPEPGRWFVAVDHPASARGGARFEVCALLEGDGQPVFLSPGEASPPLDGAGAGADVAAVAWLPLDAATWAVEHGEARVRAEDRLGVRVLKAGPRSAHGVRASGLLRLGLRVPADGRVALDVATRETDGPPVLRPGVETEFALGGRHGEHADFRIVVPEGVPGLEIGCVADPGNDFDLYARLGAPAAGDDGEDDAYSLTTGSEDRLHLGGVQGVAPGTWYVRVTTTDDDDAAGGTLRLSTRTHRATVGARGETSPPRLEPGAWTSASLHPEVEGTAWFTTRVPAGATRMTVQVLEATSDVEVIVADGAHGRIRARAISERIDERLVVDLAQAGLPRDLPLAVGVVNPLCDESEVRFRVGIAFGREPALPPDLPMPPFPIPPTANDLERAAMAVVEVTMEDGEGSGVCVTPGGLVLTARHILEKGDGPDAPLQRKGILISFPYDRGRPPRQTHVADLVAEDAEADLALLRITGDVYGRPLPADPRLPFLPVDPHRSVGLGDDLSVLGYPGVGSERSRTPVILVRGVVSGVEDDPITPPWIKTDAHISAGHSGGPVLDRTHRLVGIANATLGKYDQLGLVRPLSALPPAWRAQILQGPPAAPPRAGGPR